MLETALMIFCKIFVKKLTNKFFVVFIETEQNLQFAMAVQLFILPWIHMMNNKASHPIDHQKLRMGVTQRVLISMYRLLDLLKYRIL